MWRMLPGRQKMLSPLTLTRMHSCGNVYTVYCAHPAYQTCYHILQPCKPLFVAQPQPRQMPISISINGPIIYFSWKILRVYNYACRGAELGLN